MKKTIITTVLLLFCILGIAQENEPTQYSPKVFFSIGFVTPQFYNGTELMRAKGLRDQGLSYYEDSNGDRAQVGSYGSNTGLALSLGYYFPIKSVRGLMIGLLVNSGQTGSQPSEGGYAEGYYFNFVNFGLGIQYYPFSRFPLYVKGDIGSGSVFTKNRFLDENGNQDFYHHFGIGWEAGAGLGYTLHPFSNKRLGINIETSYQYYNPRVEVSGLGDDIWNFGAFNILLGVEF